MKEKLRRPRENERWWERIFNNSVIKRNNKKKLKNNKKKLIENI